MDAIRAWRGQELRDTLARRLPLYREVATHERDVTAMTPHHVAAAVLAFVVERPRR